MAERLLPESVDGQNTSKHFTALGQPLIPSAYRILQLDLINRAGETVNIAREATSITIVEDLYSPVVICNITVRDDKNIFEEFKLNGEERLHIEIGIVPTEDAEDEIKFRMEFLVRDYPSFGKNQNNPDVQTYSIQAVSTFAYISQLTRLSRAVPNPRKPSNTGDPILEIVDVFEENLLFTKQELDIAAQKIQGIAAKIEDTTQLIVDKLLGGFLNIKGKLTGALGKLGNAIQKINTGNLPNYVMVDTSFPCINKFKGNITLRSPLAAIEFLRTKAFDENLAPFFIYNRIGPGVDKGRGGSGDTVLIQSLSSILKADPYRPVGSIKPYTYSPSYVSQATPEDSEYYNELRIRILKVVSNLQLNQLEQAARGVYGNTLWIFDYVQKDYIGKQYDPFLDQEGIIPEMRITDDPTDRPFAELKYGDLTDGIVSLNETGRITKYIKKDLHLPPPQDPSDVAQSLFTAPELYAQTFNRTSYYYSRLDYNATHEIEIYGDFNVNPGIKIELSFRKSQPTAAEEIAETEPDTIISGLYLVIAVSHRFEEGKYISRVKIVKLHTEQD